MNIQTPPKSEDYWILQWSFFFIFYLFYECYTCMGYEYGIHT